MINKIKLLDGSMSFPLEQLGYNLKNKLWTGMALISDPNIIKNIHKDYINAGADYISTSTYQVSYDRLQNMGYQSSEIKKVFQKSVDLVKEAIKESESKKEIKIVGSFGPFASYDPNASEYVGKYNSTDDEIKNFHLNNINIIILIKCITNIILDILALSDKPNKFAIINNNNEDNATKCKIPNFTKLSPNTT